MKLNSASSFSAITVFAPQCFSCLFVQLVWLLSKVLLFYTYPDSPSLLRLNLPVLGLDRDRTADIRVSSWGPGFWIPSGLFVILTIRASSGGRRATIFAAASYSIFKFILYNHEKYMCYFNILMQTVDSSQNSI